MTLKEFEQMTMTELTRALMEVDDYCPDKVQSLGKAIVALVNEKIEAGESPANVLIALLGSVYSLATHSLELKDKNPTPTL